MKLMEAPATLFSPCPRSLFLRAGGFYRVSEESPQREATSPATESQLIADYCGFQNDAHTATLSHGYRFSLGIRPV
jgi:hypothetical protein